MAETTKSRKPPEPRGLSVTLPLEQSTEVHDLAQMAGHSTKAQVEAELVEWLVAEGLDYFRAVLAHRAQKRLDKIKAPDLKGAEVRMLSGNNQQPGPGLTPDGGIPLVPAKEGA